MRDPYGLWLSLVTETEASRKGHLSGIRKFEAWVCEDYGLDVKGIPSCWREAKYSGVVERERYLDQLKDVLKDYFGYLKGLYAPLTVNRMMAQVTSYLHAFEIPVRLISIRYAHVTYHNRDISKQEIRVILDHSSVRNRAMFLMLYESGMRPDTQVKLRWKHIKEEFLAHKIPMKIELTSDILKCRVSERWTFIGEEGFKALKSYLVTRLPLKEEDHVFVSERPEGRKLGSNSVSEAFNKLVKKLDLAEPKGRKPKEIRLYCLRKAFGKIDVEEAYKEFWKGHTDTKTHYVSRDPEYHRQLYAEGYENLRLYKPEVDSETIAKLARENLELKARLERVENLLERVAKAQAEKKRLMRMEENPSPLKVRGGLKG